MITTILAAFGVFVYLVVGGFWFALMNTDPRGDAWKNVFWALTWPFWIGYAVLATCWEAVVGGPKE